MSRLDQKVIVTKQSLGNVLNIMVRYMEPQVDYLQEVTVAHSLMDQSLKKVDYTMSKYQLKEQLVLDH